MAVIFTAHIFTIKLMNMHLEVKYSLAPQIAHLRIGRLPVLGRQRTVRRHVGRAEAPQYLARHDGQPGKGGRIIG